MKVEIDLPPKTIRMIQALNVLRGKKGGSDIETLLSKIVQKSLKQQFAEELELEFNPPAPKVTAKESLPEKEVSNGPPLTKSSSSAPDTEAMSIDEGLGDEFDYEEQKEEESAGPPDEQAFVPKSGGLTEEEMESDMAVTDPEKEAKVEAPPSKPQPEESGEAEETFQQMMLGDTPTDYVDQRVAKRHYKNKNARRAKVNPYKGEGTEAGGAVEASL